jgi:hypothetical protein
VLGTGGPSRLHFRAAPRGDDGAGTFLTFHENVHKERGGPPADCHPGTAAHRERADREGTLRWGTSMVPGEIPGQAPATGLSETLVPPMK